MRELTFGIVEVTPVCFGCLSGNNVFISTEFTSGDGSGLWHAANFRDGHHRRSDLRGERSLEILRSGQTISPGLGNSLVVMD
jgi:hypothetical protein